MIYLAEHDPEENLEREHPMRGCVIGLLIAIAFWLAIFFAVSVFI